MPERSADWMAQAERDLAAAELARSGGFYEWACFMAQQAAEKAVKAVYQHLHGEVRGHAINLMLARLPGDLAPSSELLEQAKSLDRHYIQPRYPNGFDQGAPKDYYSARDAERAQVDARAILEYCKDHIS